MAEKKNAPAASISLSANRSVYQTLTAVSEVQAVLFGAALDGKPVTITVTVEKASTNTSGENNG